MKKFVWLLCLLFARPALAATINVPACSIAALATSVNAASPGDILIVPSGSTTATSPVAIAKSLDVRFDPNCTITDNYTLGDLFTLTEPLVGEIRVSGGRFITGTGPVGGIPYHFVRVNRTTNGIGVVWTDSFFNLGFGANAFGVNSNRGVIARNTFTASVTGGTCSNNASALRLKPISSGAVWNGPHLWGTADSNQDRALFFETNTLTNVFEGVDNDDNGIIVIRYNTFTNSGIIHHGVDTGFDGARASEIYNNQLKAALTTVACAPDLPPGTNSMIRIRGGTTRIHDNLIEDITSMAWGDKAEVGFAMDELRRNAGRVPCTTTYPGFHQTGWGHTVGGTTVLNQTQDLEPSYIWNNTGGGNYASPAIQEYSPNQCGIGAPSVATFVMIGREVILGAAPSYTPASYPHPRVNVGPPIPPVEPPTSTVCITDPLDMTGIKWPTGTTGKRSIAWNSGTKRIASMVYATPGVTVFTDTRTCTDTETK